tara:strand:- start:59727 stop:59996 length:270 start_codon:yes stop_codon:yes gene_type:complete
MATLYFSVNLARQVECPDLVIEASSIAELFAHYFARYPKVRSYVLDDQGAIRKHVAVIADGLNIRDRIQLSDLLNKDSEVYIFQALSGG